MMVDVVGDKLASKGEADQAQRGHLGVGNACARFEEIVDSFGGLAHGET